MPITTSHEAPSDKRDLDSQTARHLVRTGHAERDVLAPLRRQYLQAHGQTPAHPAGHADAWEARQVAAEGEDIAEVHRQRVLGLRAQLEGDRGRGRADDGVALLERVVEVALDEG